MKNDRPISEIVDYEEPIPYDIRNRDGLHETVRFISYKVKIGALRYKICGTRRYFEDCIHILENAETGQFKEVTGKTIRVWLDKYKKKLKNT